MKKWTYCRTEISASGDALEEEIITLKATTQQEAVTEGLTYWSHLTRSEQMKNIALVGLYEEDEDGNSDGFFDAIDIRARRNSEATVLNASGVPVKYMDAIRSVIDDEDVMAENTCMSESQQEQFMAYERAYEIVHEKPWAYSLPTAGKE